jgi:hemerythrin
MALINWSDNYSVKVAKFDSQHKNLINLINELHSAMSSGKGKETIKPTLEKLVDYTIKHFTDEEQEMKRTGYTAYLSHKFEHDKLTKTAKELYAKVNSGQSVLSMDVMSFLRDWLMNHIVKVDKQYSDHMAGKGIR